MSNLVDMVIGFIATLISAALVHFGAYNYSPEPPKAYSPPSIVTQTDNEVSDIQSSQNSFASQNSLTSQANGAIIAPAQRPEPPVPPRH